MKQYPDSEFGKISVTKTLNVIEKDPETNEEIGQSIDDICKLPNGEFVVYRVKTFNVAPTHPYQSRHYICREWVQKIMSNEIGLQMKPINNSEGQHDGNLYTSFSKQENGDFFITTMKNYFTYDKSHEEQWFLKREWIEPIYEIISEELNQSFQ